MFLFVKDDVSICRSICLCRLWFQNGTPLSKCFIFQSQCVKTLHPQLANQFGGQCLSKLRFQNDTEMYDLAKTNAVLLVLV